MDLNFRRNIMECTLCDDNTADLTHLPLYVIGSEGIEVCLQCRIILTNVAKGIMETSTKVKMQTIKKYNGGKKWK